MTIYTLIFGILSTIGLTARREREKLLLGLSLLFLLFFMGTRFEVGCDFAGYQNRFDNIEPHTSWLTAFSKPEIAFSLLEIAFKTSNLSFVWLTFSATAIMLTCYWTFLKRVPYGLLILALLFPIMMLQLGMSGIRQGIAVGFLLLAANSFMKGQRLWVGIWIVVGSQFHLSVTAFLPIAFLAGREMSVRQLIAAALLLSPVALLLVGDRIDTYQDRYIDEIYGDQTSGGAGFRYILNIVPAMFFYYFRDEVRARFPREYGILLVFAIVTAALAPLLILSTFALHRFNFYLMPFTIMMAIYTVHCIPSRRDRMLALLLPIGAYGGYTVFWQQFSFHFEYCYSVYQSYLAL